MQISKICLKDIYYSYKLATVEKVFSETIYTYLAPLYGCLYSLIKWVNTLSSFFLLSFLEKLLQAIHGKDSV